VLPPEVEQRFLPVRSRPGGIVYRPALFAVTRVHYAESRQGIEHDEELSLLAPLAEEGEVDWYAAEPVDLWKEDLESEPAAGARFAPLPDAAVRTKSYDGWRRDLLECLYRTRRCDLLRSPALGELSRPGELERDFRIRLADLARARRDEQVEALRKRYASRFSQIEERIRRAEQHRERQADQVRSQGFQTLLSAGTAVAAVLFGGGRRSRGIGGALGRASAAARSAGRTFDERRDVKRAAESVEALQQQLADLNAELEAEVERLAGRFDPETEPLETVSLKPRKNDVEVRLLTLAWEPLRPAGGGEQEAAWR
jgi:hypothetical protein